MVTVSVSAPDGGRAVFTRRNEGTADRWSTDIPGSVELPALTGDGYFQVTLRVGESSAWSETFAVRPPASGTHDLEDLERLPLGEAAAGGFALTERVAEMEHTLGGEVFDRLGAHELGLEVVEGAIMPVSPWSGVSARMDHMPGYGPVSDLGAGTYTASGPDASAGAVRLQLAVRTHGQEATVALSAGSRSASSALPASDRWHLVQLDVPAGSGTTEVQVQAQGRVLLGWPVIGTGVERSA